MNSWRWSPANGAHHRHWLHGTAGEIHLGVTESDRSPFGFLSYLRSPSHLTVPSPLPAQDLVFNCQLYTDQTGDFRNGVGLLGVDPVLKYNLGFLSPIRLAQSL